jgi:hypothetical protein
MTSQLNYYVVQQRLIEYRSRAEHARLVTEARRTRVTLLGRVFGARLALHRFAAARLAAGFGRADGSPSPEPR